MIHKLFVALLAAVSLSTTVAQPSSTKDFSQGARPERGWFYFDDPKKKEPPEEQEVPKAQLPSKLPPPPKEDHCKKKDTWKPSCGFVNPGDDFEFQAVQRDALMQRMSVAKNDPKAVEDFQYYMRWVIERTTEVTNNWWYNMVQNPELDPNVASPVSAFGTRLMTEVKKGQDKDVFDLIKSEGGFLVYFTRSDCVFCHQMSETVVRLGEATGLEVRNAALDATCITPFEKGCLTAPKTLGPAQALQVTTVPTVFLYVPKNTWIRIGTGVVDTASMVTRVSQFFAAYQAALLQGAESAKDGRAPVDFSAIAKPGVTKGIEKSAEPLAPPSQDDINKMLGVTTKKATD